MGDLAELINGIATEKFGYQGNPLGGIRFI
jgi:hypothetical protein